MAETKPIRWVENVSMRDAHLGHHSDLGENVMLIRIQDPATEFQETKYNFKEVHCFEFLDVEADGLTNNGDGQWADVSEFAITDEQAQEIAGLLQRAFQSNMNVLVHCHAGICRSGAVTEVATMLGFTATDRYRQPNLLVKSKLMKALGWAYE